MFRSIRVDHTNCLQVDIKTHSFQQKIFFVGQTLCTRIAWVEEKSLQDLRKETVRTTWVLRTQRGQGRVQGLRRIIAVRAQPPPSVVQALRRFRSLRPQPDVSLIGRLVYGMWRNHTKIIPSSFTWAYFYDPPSGPRYSSITRVPKPQIGSWQCCVSFSLQQFVENEDPICASTSVKSTSARIPLKILNVWLFIMNR